MAFLRFHMRAQRFMVKITIVKARRSSESLKVNFGEHLSPLLQRQNAWQAKINYIQE